MSPNGALAHRGDTRNLIGKGTLITSVVNPFGHLVISCRTEEKALVLLTLSVSADGQSVRRLRDSHGQTKGSIDANALMVRPYGTLSAVRTEEGMLKLIAWKQSQEGDITRAGDSERDLAQEDTAPDKVAALVTLCSQSPSPGFPPIVNPVKSADEGNLRIITWDDTLPEPVPPEGPTPLGPDPFQ